LISLKSEVGALLRFQVFKRSRGVDLEDAILHVIIFKLSNLAVFSDLFKINGLFSQNINIVQGLFKAEHTQGLSPLISKK